MYTIMNNQPQQPDQLVYGNIDHGGSSIVTDSIPPLQPLQNYTTYELVPAQDTGVVFQNETTNIIVSAMQVPGQEELVFFQDQNDPTSSLAYSIEVQEPAPPEYYPEHAQQHVLTYEPLQVASQHSMQSQQVVAQHNMQSPQHSMQQSQQPTQHNMQQLSPHQSQQMHQSPQPLQHHQQQQQQQQVVAQECIVETSQQIPSGQILKQTLQNTNQHNNVPSSQQVHASQQQQQQVIHSPQQQQVIHPSQQQQQQSGHPSQQIRSQVQISPVMNSMHHQQQPPRQRMISPQQQQQQQQHHQSHQQQVYLQQQGPPPLHHQQPPPPPKQQQYLQERSPNDQQQQQQQAANRNNIQQQPVIISHTSNTNEQQHIMQQRNAWEQHQQQQQQQQQQQNYQIQQQQSEMHHRQQPQQHLQQQQQQIQMQHPHQVQQIRHQGMAPPSPNVQQQYANSSPDMSQHHNMQNHQPSPPQPQQQQQYVYQVVQQPRPSRPTGSVQRPRPQQPRPVRNMSPRVNNIVQRPRIVQQTRMRQQQARLNGPVTLTNIRHQGVPRQYQPNRYPPQQQRFEMSGGPQQESPQHRPPGTPNQQKCIIVNKNGQYIQIPAQPINHQQPMSVQQTNNCEQPSQQQFNPNDPASKNISVVDPSGNIIKAVLLPKMRDPMQNTAAILKGPNTPGGGKDIRIVTVPAPNGNQVPQRVRGPNVQGQRILNVGNRAMSPGAQYVQCRSPRPQGPNIMSRTPQQRPPSLRPPMTPGQGMPRNFGQQPTIIQRASNMGGPPQSMSPRPQQQMMNPQSPGSGPNMRAPHYEQCDSMQQDSPSPAPVDQAPVQSPMSEPTPVEEDVYKAGFLALCSNCGGLSPRINRCNRCNHKIPTDCKLISNPAVTGGGAPPGGGEPKKKKEENKLTGGEKTNSPKPATPTSGVNSPGGGVTGDSPAPGPTLPAPAAPKLTRSRKAAEEPPEILVISSDEEDEDGTSGEDTTKPFPTLSDKEPQINEFDSPQSIRVCGGGIPDDNVLDELTEEGGYTHLNCRTIRIGSLKVFPKERVFISKHGMKLIVPMNQEKVELKIYRHEIVKVLAHFGKGMPVIFYYIRAHVGPRIRDQLKMSKTTKFYFDPSSRDETHRRITLLPEKIPDEVKSILSSIYTKGEQDGSDDSQSIDGPCLEELNIKEANNILVKSSPPELKHMNSNISIPNQQPSATPVQTIFIYKATGISINTEDYACLDREQFINDVIIDFYLGFLLQEMATPDIKAKTHIFSTFFYKRLTQKPTRRVTGSIENDPNVSAAKKRHSRVQSWTKNINVFEKDFIVVPINSNAHWFLAIICFPGLKGCVTQDGRAVEECQRFKSVRKRERIKLDELQKTGKSSGPVTIGNTTISAVNKTESLLVNDEDEENRDEADSEGEDLNFGEESQEGGQEKTAAADRAQSPLRDFDGPVRHPCILIFDSLPQAGNSRSRVVATLRDWLSVEYQVKHGGASRDFSKNVMIGTKPKVPMQTNYYDCGLYLLHYAERFFLEPLIDYRLPIGLENWFTAYDTSRKRYDLQHLLFVLMERQGVDRTSLNLPHLNLDDPDYRSPEPDPDQADMEAKFAVQNPLDNSTEEAEGDEEDMEEEEEEGGEGEKLDSESSMREEGEICDMNSSHEEMDESVVEEKEEEIVDEQDSHQQHDEEEEGETVRPPNTPTTSCSSNTKQIMISSAGRISSVPIVINKTAVGLIQHTPRPKSKRFVIPISSASPAGGPTLGRRIVIPSEALTPATGSLVIPPIVSNVSELKRVSIVPVKPRLAPLSSRTPVSKPLVKPVPKSVAGKPSASSTPKPKELPVSTTPVSDTKRTNTNNTNTRSNSANNLDALKNNKNITIKRKISQTSSGNGTPPLVANSSNNSLAKKTSNLRNMRIVKKMKTEGDEDEEELEEGHEHGDESEEMGS